MEDEMSEGEEGSGLTLGMEFGLFI